MTKSEFLAKYGDVVVAFARYSNYYFYYQSTRLTNGSVVEISRGGSMEKLEKLVIQSGDRGLVREMNPEMGVVTNTEGRIEESFV